MVTLFMQKKGLKWICREVNCSVSSHLLCFFLVHLYLVLFLLFFFLALALGCYPKLLLGLAERFYSHVLPTLPHKSFTTHGFRGHSHSETAADPLLSQFGVVCLTESVS